jgi:hypothetical protein
MHLRYYRDHQHLDELDLRDVVHLHLFRQDLMIDSYRHLLVHLHHLDAEQNLDDLHHLGVRH